MSLYTRTGDRGETSLLDGSRVSKDHPRVAAFGAVDELNSLLGWCGCGLGGSGIAISRLERIQRELFSIGAELALSSEKHWPAENHAIGAERVGRLEQWIDEACRETEPLAHFVLPTGAELAARLHIARACCRRTERAVVALQSQQAVRQEIVMYLNRLSDLLFAWARQANHETGVQDVPWIPTEE